MKQKILACLLALSMLCSLTACDDDSDERMEIPQITGEAGAERDETAPNVPVPTVNANSGDTSWAIYLYLCGSDLESDYGAATVDLDEIQSIDLPENVQVVIQTGGAYAWDNDYISADASTRLLYETEGMTILEENPQANMGDAQTLADFVQFSTTNYPADRTALILWNHGAGSLSGVCVDENYDGDSLYVGELYNALSAVLPADVENPPLDIIGFDACLMATYDTAYQICDFAKYMVASQEIEPGCGWSYDGILDALATDPNLDPLALSQIICDTYADTASEYPGGDEITLSVVDLQQIPDLVSAVEVFYAENLLYAAENPSYLATFFKQAKQVENYGGNTDRTGYFNMADLGGLAEIGLEYVPESAEAVLDLVDSAVVYRIESAYRDAGSGISAYHAYDGDYDTLDYFAMSSAGQSNLCFYEFALTGDLSQESIDYVDSVLDGAVVTLPETPDQPETAQPSTDDATAPFTGGGLFSMIGMPELTTLSDTDWENIPLTIENNCATLTLGPQAVDMLSSVSFDLYYYDEAEDILISLGTDDNIMGDWETGVFQDNFTGYWGAIDGSLCYMELTQAGEEYNIYAVPVYLNGELYNLVVIYDYELGAYMISGARKPKNDYGAPDKNIVMLQAGDEIIPILYAASLYGDDDFISFENDTIIVTENTVFEDVDLGDGDFAIRFVMEDYQSNITYSDYAYYHVAGMDLVAGLE